MSLSAYDRSPCRSEGQHVGRQFLKSSSVGFHKRRVIELFGDDDEEAMLSVAIPPTPGTGNPGGTGNGGDPASSGNQVHKIFAPKIVLRCSSPRPTGSDLSTRCISSQDCGAAWAAARQQPRGAR